MVHVLSNPLFSDTEPVSLLQMLIAPSTYLYISSKVFPWLMRSTSFSLGGGPSEVAGQLFIPNSPPALRPVIESAVGIHPNSDQGIMKIFYRKFFLIRKRKSFPPSVCWCCFCVLHETAIVTNKLCWTQNKHRRSQDISCKDEHNKGHKWYGLNRSRKY